jgi:hypothetical protein
MNTTQIVDWTLYVSKLADYGGGESNYGHKGTEREVVLATIADYGPRWLQILMLDPDDCDNSVSINREDPESLDWAEEYFDIDLSAYRFTTEELKALKQSEKRHYEAYCRAVGEMRVALKETAQ